MVKKSDLEEKEKLSITRNPISFYDSGKPKGVNLFVNQNGKNTLVAYEELHENGVVKIKGSFDEKGRRKGLWESYYEDNTPWSNGIYINGNETGLKQVWYPNGKLRYQGEMLIGEPTGAWVFWSETGVKTEKFYQ